MRFCFRLRLSLGTTVSISSDANELALATVQDDGETVVLRPTEVDTSIGDSRELVVRGEGYETEDAATAAANLWHARLQAAFARLNIGADFGRRSRGGGFTEYALTEMSQQSGERILNDERSMVFECDPPPRFISVGLASGVVGKPASRLVEAVRLAASRSVSLTDREQLAYDLYSASFSERSPDARFIMLMMAVETLIVLEPRALEVAEHVDTLISATRGTSLPANEVASIVGTLRWLYEESISQGGRRLARTLGDRTYMNESAAEFFGICYTLRSRLVHGDYPRPSASDVDLRAANLEVFTSHLLGIAMLDDFDF